MEDLIYSFLLQCDYPRSSIVHDVDLLGVAPRVDSGLDVPTFAIVDPDTAAPLAVIQVVDALDIDELKQAAIETGAYASRLAGKFIQGFVIRVDVRGRSEAEQVQFYKIWPNSTLQQLSSKNFPDLQALRVSRMLVTNTNAKVVQSVPEVGGPLGDEQDDNSPSISSGDDAPSAGLYIPAILLLILIFADGMFNTLRGEALLTIPQSILAFGAAMLLTIPAAIRYLR